MAITPTKPDFHDVTSRGKVRVWATPTIAVTTDTIAVPGLKRVFSVSVGSRPTITFSSSAGAAGGLVITVGVTASCTGGATPLVIYGQ